MKHFGASTANRGPGRPRADQQAPRHAAILEAAAAVFLETGFARASTKEIARRAGASKQTFYSRYPTKAELFAAVMKHRSEKLVDPVASAILHDTAPPPDVLSRYALRVLRANLGVDGQRLQRLLVAEAPLFPDLAQLFWQNGPGFGRELVKQYLESLNSKRILSIPNTNLAADQFMSLVFGWISLRSSFHLPSAFPNGRGLTKWVHSAVDLFLRGYGYTSPATPRAALK